MKKKTMYYLLIIIIVLLLARCFGPKRYRFSQSTDQIASIDIVEGMTANDARRGDFSNIVVLASIPEEEWNQFLTEFSSVKRHSHIGDPLQGLGGRIFRITYNDGGIELVGRLTGYYYRWNEDGIGKFKPTYFDEEQFEHLIEKYLNEFGVGN